MKKSLQHFIPGVSRPDPGTRNAKGEWRPDYPCRYAPVFVWPPNPLAFLKWLLTWPGFMWPRNLVLLAISAVSWIWFKWTSCLSTFLSCVLPSYVLSLSPCPASCYRLMPG